MAAAESQGERAAGDTPALGVISIPSPGPPGPLSPGLWSPLQQQRPARSLALPLSPVIAPAPAAETMLGAFRPRTIGRIVWLFYDRPALPLALAAGGATAADEPPNQGAAPLSKATTTTVGKIGLTIADGAAHIEQIEVYRQYRGRQVSPSSSTRTAANSDLFPGHF